MYSPCHLIGVGVEWHGEGSHGGAGRVPEEGPVQDGREKSLGPTRGSRGVTRSIVDVCLCDEEGVVRVEGGVWSSLLFRPVPRVLHVSPSSTLSRTGFVQGEVRGILRGHSKDKKCRVRKFMRIPRCHFLSRQIG